MNTTDAFDSNLIKPLGELIRTLLKEAGIDSLTKWPKPLFHYTTATGLEGIIRSKQIWATNTDYLNDPSEIAYGRTLAINVLREECRILNEELPNSIFPPYDKEEPKSLKDKKVIIKIITDLHESLSNDKILNYYVVSFCQSGDLLSQWRGYGNNGGGYAIGFKIKKSEGSTHTNASLRKVLYNKKKQHTLTQGLIKGLRNILSAYFSTVEHEENPDLKDMVTLANVFVRKSLIQLKSPDFSGEREWRLCVERFEEDPNGLNFRDMRGILVPYLELPIVSPEIEIVSIRCGPTLHPELSVQSVEMLLAKHGMKQVQVYPSGITLRS